MATEEIKVTFENPGIDFKDGDIIVARVSPRHPVSEMLRVRDAINAWLQETGRIRSLVVLCASDTRIEALSEIEMNRLGWFRHPVDFNAPAEVEMAVRADGKVAWVNVNGKCELRASNISNLVLLDQRDTAKQD